MKNSYQHLLHKGEPQSSVVRVYAYALCYFYRFLQVDVEVFIKKKETGSRMQLVT